MMVLISSVPLLETDMLTRASIKKLKCQTCHMSCHKPETVQEEECPKFKCCGFQSHRLASKLVFFESRQVDFHHWHFHLFNVKLMFTFKGIHFSGWYWRFSWAIAGWSPSSRNRMIFEILFATNTNGCILHKDWVLCLQWRFSKWLGGPALHLSAEPLKWKGFIISISFQGWNKFMTFPFSLCCRWLVLLIQMVHRYWDEKGKEIACDNSASATFIICLDKRIMLSKRDRNTNHLLAIPTGFNCFNIDQMNPSLT